MDNEPEMIRQQMDDTRTALTDKVELLEQRVVNTVQSASAAVSETVESVQDIVHETVQTVKNSVQDTVDSVKDTFDLELQVDRRPWTTLAGATALGVLGGYLLGGGKARQAKATGTSSITARIEKARAVARNGARENHHSDTSHATKSTDGAVTQGPRVSDHLGDMFQAEISQLRGLAIGTLFGIVRDIVMKAVPEPIERQVADVINGITVKLGGQPIHGHVLPEWLESGRLAKDENQEDQGCREKSPRLDLLSRVSKKS